MWKRGEVVCLLFSRGYFSPLIVLVLLISSRLYYGYQESIAPYRNRWPVTLVVGFIGEASWVEIPKIIRTQRQ